MGLRERRVGGAGPHHFFSGHILGVGCLLLLALQILARFFNLPLLLLRSLALLLKLIVHTFISLSTKPSRLFTRSRVTTRGHVLRV